MTFRPIAIFVFSFWLIGYNVIGQPEDAVDKLLNSLTPSGIPTDLLATKTVALFQPEFSTKELQQIQTGFERTGVDVVLYYPSDYPFSNREIQKLFSDYLTKREIKYLLILKKNAKGYQFTFTEFDKTMAFAKAGQPCWKMEGPNLQEISLDIFRTALNSQKRLNMLVAPTPEVGVKLRLIRGQRIERYATDLRIDRLAVIKFGDAQWDKELEELLKVHYPLKYELFEPGTLETDLRKKGFLFILHYFHTRGKVAMDFLGYDMSKIGNSIASISYASGQLELKTAPAEQTVYKFYFKQLENLNVYLGSKWDADIDWKQALINQIKGLKAELKIN